MRLTNRTVIVLLLLLAPTFLFGQAFTGTIRGTVKDQTGAILPGVALTITQVGTNQTRSVLTNEAGDYNVPFLTGGAYRVQAELSGFKTEVRERIEISVDQVTRIDFALQVGEITEKLVVTEAAPLVSTDRADVGNVVDQKKVVELPLNGRGFETLALIQPGTLAPAQGSALGFRGGFNVAGSREVSNNFIVDGVDNNNLITGEVVYRPNPDVIQEFKVQTNAYSAEFGRGTGGQINITTKSGSNEFHGSVYEFFRNDVLDARNFFADKKAKLRHNQYGANLGGPIKKNRSFFLFSFEGLRRSEGYVNLSTAPTLKMRSGDFSEFSTQVVDPLTNAAFPGNIIPQSRINAVSRQILTFYPLPNRAGTSTNLLAAPEAIQRDDAYSGRVDHRFTDKDNMMFRLSHENPPSVYPYGGLGARTGVPGFGRNDSQSKTSSTLNYIRILSPSVVNELRLGYNLLHSNRRQIDPADYAAQLGLMTSLPPGVNRILPKDAGLPSISVTGVGTIATYRPQERKDHTYQIQDSVSWQSGTHSVRLGVDLRKFMSNSFTTGNTAGQFTFDNGFSRLAFANFLLGYPSRTQVSGGDNDGRVRKTEAYHWFIQDDWHVSNRVTVNLGVRYELNMPGYDEQGRAGSYDPKLGRVITGQEPGIPKGLIATDKNNWGPRFGFAWRPFNDDKTALRAGYGVFYHTMILGNETSIILFGFPFRPTFQFNAPSTASPVIPLLTFQNPFPADRATDSSSPGSINRDTRSTYVQNYSLSFQRQLTNDVVLELAYSGNLGRKLLGQFALNQPRPGAGNLNTRRPIPGYSEINQRFAGLNSVFNSLQGRLEKRFSGGFSILGAWTYSHTIDQGSEHSYQAQDTLNWRAERASADFDVRHRLVVSYIYDLPIGKGRKFKTDAGSLAEAVIGGWQISGISTLQSGQPLTVISQGSGDTSADISNTGARRDRPNLIGDPKVSTPAPQNWINPAAFALNAPFTFGNAGRNIMAADDLTNFDFSIMKNFYYRGEPGKIQFRAEFFNLFNHANFNKPNLNFGTPAFGKIDSARDPRQVQFGLKLYY